MSYPKHSYTSWYGIFEEAYYAGTSAAYDVTPLVEGTVITTGDVAALYQANKSMKLVVPDSTMERTPLKEIGAGLYPDDIIDQRVKYEDGRIEQYVQSKVYIQSAMGINVAEDTTAPGETPPSYTIHAYNTIESFEAYGCVIKDYTLECKVDELCKETITFLHHKTANVTDYTPPTGTIYKTAGRLHFSETAITVDSNSIDDMYIKGFSLKITNEFHPTITLEDYYRRMPVLKARTIDMEIEFEADASQFITERFAVGETAFTVDFKLGPTGTEIIDSEWTNMYVDEINWQELADPGEVYQYRMVLKNGAGMVYTDSA